MGVIWCVRSILRSIPMLWSMSVAPANLSERWECFDSNCVGSFQRQDATRLMAPRPLLESYLAVCTAATDLSEIVYPCKSQISRCLTVPGFTITIHLQVQMLVLGIARDQEQPPTPLRMFLRVQQLVQQLRLRSGLHFLHLAASVEVN